MILYSEGSTKAQEDEANQILEALTIAYPGHPWGVRVYDGGFFIQYLLVPWSKPYGMNCKYKQFGYSASALKRQIILMAGEWLERAGLSRGRFNGDEIQKLDGIEKFRNPAPAQVETVINTSDHEVRTAPRPQALKELERG